MKSCRDNCCALKCPSGIIPYKKNIADDLTTGTDDLTTGTDDEKALALARKEALDSVKKYKSKKMAKAKEESFHGNNCSSSDQGYERREEYGRSYRQRASCAPSIYHLCGGVGHMQ